MQQINYLQDVQQPFESSASGIQAAIGISQAMDQNAARQQQLMQQQANFAQAQQQARDLAELGAKENPTAQDFAAITTKYPQLAEHFKNTWSMLSKDRQQTQLGQASQVYAALQAGKPDVAQQILAQQSEAARNSGDVDVARHADVMSSLISQNPRLAVNSAGLMLASVLGPDKFAENYATLSKLPGEVQKGQAEAAKSTYEAAQTPQRLVLESRYKAAQIRDLDSQIADRANRYSLDRDKLQSDVELKLTELGQKSNPALNLGDDAKKIINDSTVSSVSADQTATQTLDLANRLEKMGGGYGSFSRIGEWLKQQTGSQDAMTDLRKEYARLRQAQMKSVLPPGPATDKDVALALSGFPPDTADARTMASFLRGMAKIQQTNAATEGVKAEWVNAVGHLGKAKSDIEIEGVHVPKGTTFIDFAKQFVAKKATQRAAQQGQAQVQNRSYMRWAQ